MSYRMIAKRENESINVLRDSAIIIAAKARIFASAGWSVVVTDDKGATYRPADFEKLLKG